MEAQRQAASVAQLQVQAGRAAGVRGSGGSGDRIGDGAVEVAAGKAAAGRDGAAGEGALQNKKRC